MNDDTDVLRIEEHPLVPLVLTKPADAIPGIKEIVKIAAALENAADGFVHQTKDPRAAAGAGILEGHLQSIVAICAMMVECMVEDAS